MSHSHSVLSFAVIDIDDATTSFSTFRFVSRSACSRFAVPWVLDPM